MDRGPSLSTVVAAALLPLLGCATPDHGAASSDAQARAAPSAAQVARGRAPLLAARAAAAAPPDAGPPTCTAARLENETEGDALFAALFPGWDRNAKKAPLRADTKVADCVGHTAETDWSGADRGAPSPGQARVMKRQALQTLEGDRAFYFVATGLAAGACSGEDGFLVLARVTHDEAHVEASGTWGVVCNAPYELRPIHLRGGVVYAEPTGRFGSGAGYSASDAVWLVAPPEMRVLATLSTEENADCPMMDPQTCERSTGTVEAQNGDLVHRVTTVSTDCLRVDAALQCVNERTKVETHEYLLQGGKLVKVSGG